MDPFRNGAAGVVSSAKLFRPEHFAELTPLIQLRAVALALCARLRHFDGFATLIDAAATPPFRPFSDGVPKLAFEL
jgi:hypothetical protein